MASLTLSDFLEVFALAAVFGLVAVLLLGAGNDPFYDAPVDLSADREPIRGE